MFDWTNRRTAAVAAITTCLLTFSAVAGRATPSLVVDLTSGQVLQSEEATRPWHPASLTKLMTVYVALDAVRRGKMTLQTPMRVSRRASRMAPSKMGFRPGIEITLENALKIIMVKSANDVSVTIAEGVSGSVEGFAAQMNATARALGMYESHFVNPNGLHHPDHVSSARDMAVLARALFLHFPDQHELYGIGAIRVGRRVMRNHNGLIGRYPGANGMKTGYVCASGFNVVASATRYGKTIIAVVMGSPSATVRTFQAMALLDKGFQSSGYGDGQLQSLPRSGYTSPPNMRSEICNRRRSVLIRQYMSTMTAPVAASAWSSSSSPAAAHHGEENSAAAFFAADKRGRFVTPAEQPATSGARLQLPPRAALVPIRVYVGRAPGWTGAVAGPVEAEPEKSAKDSAETTKDGKESVASRTDEKADAPLSLHGAAKAKPSKKAGARKASVRKKQAVRKSRVRNSRKALRTRKARSRSAVKSRAKATRSKISRSKVKKKTSKRTSRRR